jgi:arylsulfatase A-like enzyme
VLLSISTAAVFSAAGCYSRPHVGTTASAERPNILFVIADDASFPHFGAYGSTWVETPAFDRVAAEGILFRNAYTPNAKCAPSRAAILTGRNSWQLEDAGNHQSYFPAKFKSYAEALREHGYFVGYTGKGWAPGIAEIDGQPRALTGRLFDDRFAEPPTSGISDKDYAANFGDFLDVLPAGQAFSFWYGAYEPHRGYEFGSGERVGEKHRSQIPSDEVYSFWPDTDTVRIDLLDYALEVEHFDRHLGRMLEMLEERGLLDNTLVVVTSDQGMPFPRVKGQTYELSNHVPLAVMWRAGIRAPGRQVLDHVSFIDVAPTFLEVAGIPQTTSGMEPITGRSLLEIFNAARGGQVNPAWDYVLVGKEKHDVGRPNDQGYPVRGIISDGFLYLQNFEPDRWPAGNPETGYLNTDGSPTKTQILERRRRGVSEDEWQLSFGKRPSEEFYDIVRDPANVRNLADDPELVGRKEELRSRLFAALREQGDPRMFGRGHLFDEYPHAHEPTRNFYERFMRGESVRAGWVNETDFEYRFSKEGG